VARIDLPFVNGIIGRDGRVRYYFRKRGCKNVRLGASRAKAGTVAAIVGKYLASASFGNLADETRRTRRNILKRFREQYGDRQVATLRREHVQAMVDAKADTPSAARNLLNMLRVLMHVAVRLRRPASRIGFAICATRPGFRMGSRRTACARRCAGSSPKPDAARTGLPPSAGTRRCTRCSARLR
jgi:hypothetical protein